MTRDWGRGARESLGDEGVAGLHLARKIVQERITEIDPGDPQLSSLIESLNALELVLDAIGGLEPQQN